MTLGEGHCKFPSSTRASVCLFPVLAEAAPALAAVAAQVAASGAQVASAASGAAAASDGAPVANLEPAAARPLVKTL